MPPGDEISERTDELDGRSRDLRDAWDADCSEHGATRITELLFCVSRKRESQNCYLSVHAS